MRRQADSVVLKSGHDDPRVVHALEVYLEALENGQAPDRVAFLAEYSDVAEPLAECLDGLEFLHRASAPKMPERLGDFQILREIGRGGMGIVYEAEQVSLHRRVAVKTLRSDSLNPTDLKRFQHEAQTAALLTHPHIVPIYAVGSSRGVHYIAMQFISGRSLADWIDNAECQHGVTRLNVHPGDPTDDDGDPGVKSGVVEPPRPVAKDQFHFIAGLALQAADALSHAHALGIIHRDIKPANLLLDDNQRLWIADFGLAHVPGQTRLTQSHALIGTLRYMSPEQVEPRRGGIDHRVDLYGLGATMYELLTAQPLHATAERGELIAKILTHAPIPPRSIHPRIPRDLETIVLKLLAKLPADRYTSALDLADDLRRYLVGQPILATRPTRLDRLFRWSGQHQRLTITAVLGVVAVIALQASHQFELIHERDQTNAERQQLRVVVDDMYRNFEERILDREPSLEPVQREYLVKALAIYERLAQGDGSSPDDRLAIAQAFRRIGDIESRLGHTVDADRAYITAKSRLDHCAETPAVIRECAACANNHGNLCRTTGRYDAATEHYNAAIRQYRMLAEPQDRAGRAGAENNLGLVQQTVGNVSDAQLSLQTARTRFAQLSLEFPDDPRFREETARCCHNLANVFCDQGQLAVAETTYRDALALRLGLLDRNPTVPVTRFAVAQTQGELANLFLRLGRVKEADPLLHESTASRERLAREFPNVPQYRLDWACSLRSLAMWHQQGKRYAEAVVRFQKAIELLRPLSDGNAIASAPTELGRTWCALAACYMADGKITEAQNAIQQAGEIATTLPDVTIFDRQTKAYRAELAELLRQAEGRGGK